MGVASILLAFSSSYPLSLLLMVPVGAGGITMAATANATIQLAVPDGLRGRVMSVYTTVFSASVPIGGIGVGALAAALGVPLTVAIGGVLTLGVGVWALVWYRRIVRHALAADPGDAPMRGMQPMRPTPPRRPGRTRRPGRSSTERRLPPARYRWPVSPPPRARVPRSSHRTRMRCSAPVGRRPAARRGADPAGGPRPPVPDRRD